MPEGEYLEELKEAIVSLDFSAIVEAARKAMEAGVDPRVAITEGLVPGMAVVGEKFESGEYFLSELVVAGEVMKDGMKIIVPYIKGDSSTTAERAVICTVEGDYHDIGKNIVITLLGVQGFKVVDLGMDVAAEKVVSAVKEHKPAIVGLSALLTTTMLRMGEVIEGLKAAGLREKVRVIVGGTPVTPDFADSIGADHCAVNAMEGVHKCVEWVMGKDRR
jgi:corrinoid protein of di/trimethylamine methyltransferase